MIRMKKSLLLKTGVLGAASALVLGAAVVPFISFASEVSNTTESHVRLQRGGAGMRGAHGLVTAIDDAGDGTGTITLTSVIPKRPESAPVPDENIAEKIKENIEAFFEAHPEAPQPGESFVITYDNETRFFIGGEESSVSAVTVGMTVHVAGMTTNSDHAVRAVSDAPRPLRDADGRFRLRGVLGEVLSVDTEANTVTISLPDESDGAFVVGADVRVGNMAQAHE